MSRRSRRHHTPAFKAKVALATSKSDRTLAPARLRHVAKASKCPFFKARAVMDKVASRCVPRRRYADGPAAAFFLRAWLAPTNRSSFRRKANGLRPSRAPGVKRRQTPAPTRAVSPVFRASSHPESSRPVMRLSRPALRAALKGGDPPSLGSPWHLAAPCSKTTESQDYHLASFIAWQLCEF